MIGGGKDRAPYLVKMATVPRGPLGNKIAHIIESSCAPEVQRLILAARRVPRQVPCRWGPRWLTFILFQAAEGLDEDDDEDVKRRRVEKAEKEEEEEEEEEEEDCSCDRPMRIDFPQVVDFRKPDWVAPFLISQNKRSFQSDDEWEEEKKKWPFMGIPTVSSCLAWVRDEHQ